MSKPAAKSIPMHLDLRAFRRFMRDLMASLESVPKLPRQLRRFLGELFLDCPNEWFSLECQTAGGALRVTLQPTERVLRLLAAIRTGDSKFR